MVKTPQTYNVDGYYLVHVLFSQIPSATIDPHRSPSEPLETSADRRLRGVGTGSCVCGVYVEYM